MLEFLHHLTPFHFVRNRSKVPIKGVLFVLTFPRSEGSQKTSFSSSLGIGEGLLLQNLSFHVLVFSILFSEQHEKGLA